VRSRSEMKVNSQISSIVQVITLFVTEDILMELRTRVYRNCAVCHKTTRACGMVQRPASTFPLNNFSRTIRPKILGNGDSDFEAK